MKLKRSLLTVACVAVLSLGVTACGDDNTDTTSTTGGTTTSQTTPEAVKPVAEVASLTGKSTAVTLDAGFVKALTDLKLTPGPVGDATISKAGVASFPITGGNVKYFTPGSTSPYVQGIINHDGSGLSLTAGKTKVELTDFVVDPGKSVLTGTVSVNGKVAAESAPLFFLDGRTLKPLEANAEDGTAVLEGTTVKLKEEAAQLLNDTFKTDALEAGLVIGVAKITINTTSADATATEGTSTDGTTTAPEGTTSTGGTTSTEGTTTAPEDTASPRGTTTAPEDTTSTGGTTTAPEGTTSTEEPVSP